MSALRIENAYYIITIMCDISDREIVSKHFIQLRIRNKGRPSILSNEVSFCFSKTFVIHRCLRSKSSFFGKREMTY